MRKYWAVAVVATALLFGCKGDSGGVTGPDSIDANMSSLGVSASAEDPAQNNVPLGTGTPEQVKIWKTGKIDVLSDPFHKLGCYFENGPHEQKLHAALTLLGVGTYGPPNGLDPDVCYQVDVGDSCARSSIIPGLIAVEYIGPCEKECVPEEWEVVSEEVSEGEWGSCDNFPEASTVREICEECREVAVTTTEFNGCERRVSVADKIERREVECPCVEEPHIIETEEELAREGECSPTNVGIVPGAQCEKTDSWLITETWKQCDKTWTTERYERRTEPCECPVPEAQCFYEINCRNETFTALNGSKCPEEQKQSLCEAEGGTWGIFIGQASSQCGLPLPGILREDWRLTPGQSHADCLKFTGHD